MIAMLRSHKIKEKKHSFEENTWERPVEGRRENRKRLYVVQSHKTCKNIYSYFIFCTMFWNETKVNFCFLQHCQGSASPSDSPVVLPAAVCPDWNAKELLKLTPPSVKSFRHLKWAIEMVNIWIALNKLQSLLPKDRRLIGHLAPESHLRGTLPLWETCTSVSCRWNRAATYEASLMPHNYSRCWALKRRPCTTLLVGWEELKQAVIRIYIKSTDAWSCWRKWKFWCFSQTTDLFVYK